MSGKITIPTNEYSPVDQDVQYSADTKETIPFSISRKLDIVRNDGPGKAVISLDAGKDFPLDVGDYIGPWDDFTCSTLYARCTEPEKASRIRAIGY